MTNTEITIPTTPTEIAYNPSADELSICIGLVIDPIWSRWVSVSDTEKADAYHAFGQQLVDAYNARMGYKAADEYEIVDSEYFPVTPDSIEEAVLYAEIKSLLTDEQFAALGDWMGHNGKDYTLYNSGELQDASDITSAFEESYIGTYESEEDYAQERLGEMWDNSLDTKTRKEMEHFSRYVFNHMNWERLARDFEVDDVWYGERNENGVPVFRRN